MDRWSGRVALVTGASSGIGAEICRSFVKAGLKVVGVARRLERIEDLEKELQGEPGSLYPMKCDLSDFEQINELFSDIEKKLGGIDICVSNAAYFERQSLLDGDPTSWEKMMRVNTIAYALCAKLSVASMKKRNVDDGHIIFISSIMGQKVGKFKITHFYSATKFAVRALAEGFTHELRAMKSNIRMTCITPGLVQTDIFESASLPSDIVERMMSTGTPLSTQDIASAVTYAISCPQHVQVNDIVVVPTYMPNAF